MFFCWLAGPCFNSSKCHSINVEPCHLMVGCGYLYYLRTSSTFHWQKSCHLYDFFCHSDFLTRSYDIGGVISVMALSGLFILMTQHGLEYPKFYEKLYALLTPAVFMAKHRSVFLQVSGKRMTCPHCGSSSKYGRSHYLGWINFCEGS